MLTNASIKGGVTAEISGLADRDLSVLSSLSDSTEAEITIELKELKAPVYVNEKIGTATVTKNGETIGQIDILASQTVEKK